MKKTVVTKKAKVTTTAKTATLATFGQKMQIFKNLKHIPKDEVNALTEEAAAKLIADFKAGKTKTDIVPVQPEKSKTKAKPTHSIEDVSTPKDETKKEPKVIKLKQDPKLDLENTKIVRFIEVRGWHHPKGGGDDTPFARGFKLEVGATVDAFRKYFRTKLNSKSAMPDDFGIFPMEEMAWKKIYALGDATAKKAEPKKPETKKVEPVVAEKPKRTIPTRNKTAKVDVKKTIAKTSSIADMKLTNLQRKLVDRVLDAEENIPELAAKIDRVAPPKFQRFGEWNETHWSRVQAIFDKVDLDAEIREAKAFVKEHGGLYDGNGKTVNQLIKAFPQFKGVYLDEAKNSEKITEDISVELFWDKNFNCPAIHFAQLDSFLNLPLPAKYDKGEEDDFAPYCRSKAGMNMLRKAFDFFTIN